MKEVALDVREWPLASFLEEAAEDIAAIEAGLLLMESLPDDALVLREIVRHAVSLRTSSSRGGFAELAAAADSYAAILERLEDGERELDAMLLEGLLFGVAAFRRLARDRSAVLTASERRFVNSLTNAPARQRNAVG